MQYVDEATVEADGDLRALAKRLNSPDASLRRRARRQLRHAGKKALEPLLSLLEEEKRIRDAQRVLRYGLAALTVGGYFWWALNLSDPHVWPFAIVLLLPLIVLLHLKAASKAQIEATQLLVGLQDVRAIGPLAEALEYTDLWQLSGIGKAAADALCRLLPRLQPEDSALLNERQRICLYHVLSAPVPQHPALTIATLSALTRIGDIRSLPHIERLAIMQPLTLSGKQIRDKARECFLLLQVRLESQRAPQTLLRAASADDRPDQLLHPAHDPDSDPVELLRPTSNRQD